jgi:protein SCO1/2
VSALARRAAPPPELPDFGGLPGYALVDQASRPFTPQSVAGRPFVADFVFTRCRTVCPAMTARMAQLQSKLPSEVGLVSFSVDPENDTPPVLAQYAAEWKAEPRWRFVTGPREALHGLATGGFKLAAMAAPADAQAAGEGPFLHSSKFVLVDAAGRIRGYYDSGSGEEIGTLIADASRLAAGR